MDTDGDRVAARDDGGERGRGAAAGGDAADVPRVQGGAQDHRRHLERHHQLQLPAQRAHRLVRPLRRPRLVSSSAGLSYEDQRLIHDVQVQPARHLASQYSQAAAPGSQRRGGGRLLPPSSPRPDIAPSADRCRNILVLFIFTCKIFLSTVPGRRY